nr:hypothetical protein [Mycobacterium sp. UM_NZ2]
MPTNAIDQLLADAVTSDDHPTVADVVVDPSGRPDAWCRVIVQFADGSACYITAEELR